MNSRCQFDLIDMQCNRRHDVKLVLVYQDHLTKVPILRSLQSKRTDEVVYPILNIFRTFKA